VGIDPEVGFFSKFDLRDTANFVNLNEVGPNSLFFRQMLLGPLNTFWEIQ